MKVLVVGLGSMGKRRIRLMRQLYGEDIQIFGVDNNISRAMEVAKEFHISCYDSITKAHNEEVFDSGFVCTAPLYHEKIIRELWNMGLHVFTELNLVSNGYNDFMKYEHSDRILFLSSTLIYRKDIQYIGESVKNQVVDYMYHTGQYLPDWHPWENYKEYFVSNRKTNACREIFAIDLPWIIKCFGRIKNYEVKKSKISKLEVNYSDNYMMIIEHENGTKGMICVDVVSRKAMRRLEVFNEDTHIFWEGTPNSLAIFNSRTKEIEDVKVYDLVEKDSSYCENIIENAYMEEIKVFFEAIKNQDKSKIRYTFWEDRELLSIIDQLEN
ncbi:MAG: Gfo/Idh/MocA family oxidoreductase [Lachnospiraceae bacterium]